MASLPAAWGERRGAAEQRPAAAGRSCATEPLNAVLFEDREAEVAMLRRSFGSLGRGVGDRKKGKAQEKRNAGGESVVPQERGASDEPHARAQQAPDCLLF